MSCRLSCSPSKPTMIGTSRTHIDMMNSMIDLLFCTNRGLRAVKSVLRVAGGLKRGEPDKGEDELLMRALRDFNTPKIPANDTPIFLRLIADLFMGLDAQLKVNDKLKEVVTIVTKEEKYIADDAFILKVLQFQELLDVRHSVMLLGPTGCGKTTIWKMLVNQFGSV